MAEKKSDIAVIGDTDSVLVAKAVGIEVFFEANPHKASKIIYSLARTGCKIIFITEELYSHCSEAVGSFKADALPVIIPIPGSRGSRGIAMSEIRANVEKAIGADILFTKE